MWNEVAAKRCADSVIAQLNVTGTGEILHWGHSMVVRYGEVAVKASPPGVRSFDSARYESRLVAAVAAANLAVAEPLCDPWETREVRCT